MTASLAPNVTLLKVSYRALRLDAEDCSRNPEEYEQVISSASLDMVRECEETDRDPPTGIAEALAVGAMATSEQSSLALLIHSG